ncbi:PIG-L deacetylase family protein [Nocardia takedensis]
MALRHFDQSEPGTPTTTWRPWVADLPVLTPDIEALVILAPHPDDEVLGLGALTAALASAGVSVTILAVTDGESSHPGSPTHPPATLRAIRRRESATAAEILGVARVVRLALPDGAVADHEAALTDLVGDHLTSGVTLAVPLHRDGHPDHEAAARAGAVAARTHRARLLEYPIWMWHWSHPADPDIDWARARRLVSSPEFAARKRHAAAAFTSQTAPLSPAPADRAVLPPHVLSRLLDLDEVVFV